MPKTDHTLVTDILSELKVPFTRDYTKQRFESMPFKTLFGVSQLLKEYGVESRGCKIDDKSEIKNIAAPFVAQTDAGLIIVTEFKDDSVKYLSQGYPEKMSLNEFESVITGVVLTVKALPGAKEPDYSKHRTNQFISSSKKVLLWVLGVVLAAYLMIVGGSWKYPSAWCLVGVDVFGLWLTFMLVQKSLKIKNRTADKVCGVLQEGGCDSILKTSASSFFGIFSWSEVGFTYFGVSLLVMLVSPAALHFLALINLCCLPFTVWSIWYQKFRAKHWCTLCVCVQASLWLQFLCYFFGHWQTPVNPFHIGFFALGATYVFVLLALNRILPHFTGGNDPDNQ